MKIICIKSIPTLCNEGEMGDVASTPRTIIVSGRTSFYCSDVWHRVEKLQDLIEFIFSKPFDINDISRIFGKPIELKDYFQKAE